MEIKTPKIVVATQKKEWSDTLIFDSLCKYTNTYIHLYNENVESLSKIYNQAIDEAIEQDVDCLILVHDDVILEEDPIPKLEKLFDDYDLVGVAGASKIELKCPALWHLMGGGFQGGHLHGCVQHRQYMRYDFSPIEGYYTTPKTEFGSYPHKVVMIDGVFMALNRKVMETIRFDEDCPSPYHFYDLNFSLDCHLNGCKVGVGDILITHASPGLREYTDEWEEGEKYFINKYGN